MINRNHKSGFFIGVTCPGCGDKLELKSDFFVLNCDSCDSALRVIMPKIPPAYIIRCTKDVREARFFSDRYLKKAGLPLTESNVNIRGIYQPYWKVDAILLKVRNRVQERHIYMEESGAEQDITYEQKMTDVNLTPYSITLSAGREQVEIPHSIGMRADYIRLDPYSRENIPDDFECRSIEKTWQEIISEVERGTVNLNDIDPAAFGKNKTRLFRPTASVVHFPYYVVVSDSIDGLRRLIIDGVSGRVVHFTNNCHNPEDLSSSTLEQMEFGKLEVEYHRCPNCGVDLPGKQSYAYICHNCHQLVMLENHPLMQNEIKAVVSGENQRDRLFPFWSMRLPDHHAGAVRLMFGGIYDSDQLFLPAFRVANFEAIYKLCKRMSSAAPRMEYASIDGFDDRYESVTVGLSEALVMAEVIIFRARVGKTQGEFSRVEKFEPAELSLAYAPFHPQSYFYVDSVIGAVTFEKSLVG